MSHTVDLNYPDAGDAMDPFEWINLSNAKDKLEKLYVAWLVENVPQDDCTIFPPNKIVFVHEHDATAFKLKFNL